METKSAPYDVKVRDFAYDEQNPLHHGIIEEPEVVEKSPDEIFRRAVALFDFEPENSNEIRLVNGQLVWISYRHDQGWLVAENMENGETGLVPEEYVQVLPEEEDWVDE